MLIKTQCGKEKYNELKDKKGTFNRIRFYFFIVIASFRDFKK